MINLSIPDTSAQLHPRITVVGVGGAGGNAVNNMITSNLEGVEFLVANTDAQALNFSQSDKRLQLGTGITQGLGAGSRPEIGQAAAEEAMDDIIGYLEGSHMVFITGGMGGGTGTGAGPVIARCARELGILTVGVVTKPFHFEGAHRMKVAESGIKEMQNYVDTLIVIPNQNLFRLANEKTTFAQAFQMADEVLHSGVRGVTDLMVMPGLINLDFADIRTVMSEMGKAMMGTGEAEGEKRAIEAAEAAISNPLLDDVSMKGARGVLVNITGGDDMTLYEVDEAVNRIRDEVDPDANLIFGSTFGESMNGRMRVSVVATGIEQEARMQEGPQGRPSLAVVSSRQIPAAPAQPTAPAAEAPQAEEMVLDAPVEEPVRPTRVKGLDPRMTGVVPAHPAPQQQAEPAVPAATGDRLRGERHGDAFVPPRPMAMPQQGAAPSRSMPTSAAAPAQADGQRRRGAGHLFRAMTGLLHGEEEQQPVQNPAPGAASLAQRADQMVHEHRHVEPDTGWAAAESQVPAATHQEPTAPAPVAPMPQQAAPAPRPHPMTSGRAPLPRHEDDQLEIPAFLRRQAN